MHRRALVNSEWIELDYSITATLFEHTHTQTGYLHKCNYVVVNYLHIQQMSIFFSSEVIVQLEYIHITMQSCETIESTSL